VLWVRYWILISIGLRSCFEWPIKYKTYRVTNFYTIPVRNMWTYCSETDIHLHYITLHYITYTILAMYDQQMHNISNN